MGDLEKMRARLYKRDFFRASQTKLGLHLEISRIRLAEKRTTECNI
jgi:hypothetical protein